MINIDIREIDHSKVKISIQDNSKGIPEEQLNRVFDPASTGLGLAIAKSIVSLHGGEIKLTSKYQQFTCVEITLPGRFNSLNHPSDRR
ncbi:ATP-binding protein [Legionella israelensis]|uniref:histidine kinase n=1 Tax=Legionella israelensis TaxID=454 RepID=A0AAX1EEU8_9GAMM|nr:sensor histidine kinase [Legionella israelensis]QBR83572.1 ATP-binding protein [Legionella israelensis]